MYLPVKNGSTEVIYKYKCHLPPEGYGVNAITGELEYIGILSNSKKKSEQMWTRIPLPDNYVAKRKKEQREEAVDPGYFDPELEKYRERMWRHRLCGAWFMSNGKKKYITGLHFYYLNFVQIDIGYPHFRDSDRRIFYVWRYCEEDPRSGGLLHAARRREGKTYKGGAMLLEYMSRTKNANGGIQSKTAADAKGVFQKAVVNPFKKMADFFRPVFDTSKGLTPTSELRFVKTTKTGKASLDDIDKPELDSFIDWVSSNIFSKDGRKETRGYEDEVGKTQEIDVYERWQVNRFCFDQDGEWCGKNWASTTVEEMENGGKAFREWWDASDPDVRDKNGRTKSGMYRLFIPAYETTFFDKYGESEIEKAKQYYLNQREGLRSDPRALSSIIRKNPFTEEEMFRIDGDTCLYDSEKLNDRLEYLSWKENITERGNFIWEGGIRDTRVVWVKDRNGHWEICWNFPKPDESNKIEKRGNIYRPKNTMFFVAGADTFSHDKVKDNRRSDGAMVVKMRFNPNSADPYQNAFVCVYKYRAPTASMQYEHMLMTCVYFGCKVLFESNKNNWKQYFIDRGYEHFLMKLPNYPDYGIPGNTGTHQLLAEATEEYIVSNIDNVYHKNVITDWLEFDIGDTTKSDVAMASGYCLIGDQNKMYSRKEGSLKKITDYGFYKTKTA